MKGREKKNKTNNLADSHWNEENVKRISLSGSLMCLPKEWLFNVIWLHDNHYHHYALEYFDFILNCFDIFARMRTTNFIYMYINVSNLIWFHAQVYRPRKICLDICRHFFFYSYYYFTIVHCHSFHSLSRLLTHIHYIFFQPNEFNCVNKYAWCAFVYNMCIIVYIFFLILCLSIQLFSFSYDFAYDDFVVLWPP